MTFRDVVGQKDIKKRLIALVQENRVPHAMLLCGPAGVGKFALALGLAHYILCKGEHKDNDACGECKPCKLFGSFNHPDLHFVFPIAKKTDKVEYCDKYIDQWREMISGEPYFGLNHWMEKIDAGTKAPLIYASESEAIQRKLSFKAGMGGYKVMIIWMPERMNADCANKLLKILEEPPAQTLFIMVSEHPDRLLSTITSRAQRIDVPRIAEEDIKTALVERCKLGEADAARIAHSANGSYLKALGEIHIDKDLHFFFDMYVLLMRLAYMRKIKDLKNWADQMASRGREQQKEFLIYCQKMTRENFVYNFGRHEMNYQNSEESSFSVNFARFINERNVIGIMNELSDAQRDIEQNTNSKMVFFDFAIKMIVLLIK